MGLGIAALVALTVAQSPAPEPERITGLVIDRVTFEAAPTEDIDDLRQLAGLVEGEAFSPSAVRRAVKVLFRVGRFENVLVYATRDDNRVRVRVVLPPRGIVRALEVIASEELTQEEIEEAMGATADSPIDPRRFPQMRDALEEVLRDRGFRQAAVGLAFEPADDSGGLRVLVRIDEGPQTVVRAIALNGETKLPRWEVERRLGVRPGDVVDLREIRAALEKLTQDYKRAGFWDAQIALTDVVAKRATREGSPLADVVFTVAPGPAVKVELVGNAVMPTRMLEQDTVPLVSLGTGPSIVAEVKERIVNRYHRRGHFAARVRERVTTSPDDKQRTVAFLIHEGPVGRVGRLAFPGNTEVDRETLERQVEDLVSNAMADELSRPGADPAEVSALFGDHSTQRPRTPAQPDSTAPKPDRLYIARAYQQAGDVIADMYRARGYQTVKVAEPDVRPRKNPTLLDVSIAIEPGMKWTIGALSFSGNDAVTAGALFELSGMDPTVVGGTAVSFDQVEEARRAILTKYRNDGYLYASVSESLRQVPPRGSLGSFGFVDTSTSAPLDVRAVCQRAEEAGEDTCPVELVFRIDEGPQVKTREVIVRGVNITQGGVVRSELLVKDGKILSEDDMVRTRDNLLRVGVFERVTVSPLDEDQVASEKDVIVDVRERKNYSLELGIGASTEEGVRAFAGFGDSNLGGSALRLQLLGKVNVWLPQLLVLYDSQIRERIQSFYNDFSTFERMEYEVAAGLSYPRIFGLPPGFTAGLDVIALRDYDPAFAENTQKITLIGNYKGWRPVVADAPRPVAIQVRTDFERADLDCNNDLDRPELCSTELFDPNRPRVEGSNIYISAGPSVSWDLRDEPLNPSAGAYLEVSGNYAKGLDSNSPDHVTVEGRANVYLPAPYMRGVVLAVSLLGGKIFPISSDEVPVNRRFFAGGRRTVRGYPEKTLLPQDTTLDADGVPTVTISPGGKLMLALKSEVRIALFGPLSMAMFYDVGDLWFDGNFSLSTEQTIGPADAPRTATRTLAQGIGLGVRVATPIGPLAVDFAVPLNQRDPGATDPQLHFAVGTF
ncbi:MAG: POTRA domain-containing protein [Deltaproteobacteria bacterium]|jgi:outer membrane protein assembly factor BamA